MPQLLGISFPINRVNCNRQVCNLCPQFVPVSLCFGGLVRFKTRIKVAGGHSVLFRWHGYILRHKTHRKTYWQTDTKQDCQVECVHHTTATHCHQEKRTWPSFYTLSCRIPCLIFPPQCTCGTNHSNSAWRTLRIGGWPRAMVSELPLAWSEPDNISVLSNSHHTSRVDVQTFVHRDKK